MPAWFRIQRAKPEAVARLVLFHHAGGAASAFNGWGDLAPPDVEIVAVQLPGRENRIAEEPFTDMDRLAGAIAEALAPLCDLPFAFLGHSMGARLAYATAVALAARGRPGPAALIVSASRAPHHPRLSPDMHDLPDDRFVEELAAIGGLPEAIRRSAEMMAMMTRIARADFTLLETWRPPQGVRVDAPILALGGEADRLATRAALESWADLTDRGFRLRLFDGGHFYLKDHARAVIAEAASALFRGLDGRFGGTGRARA